jgi:hypothetical protein
MDAGRSVFFVGRRRGVRNENENKIKKKADEKREKKNMWAECSKREGSHRLIFSLHAISPRHRYAFKRPLIINIHLMGDAP